MYKQTIFLAEWLFLTVIYRKKKTKRSQGKRIIVAYCCKTGSVTDTCLTFSFILLFLKCLSLSFPDTPLVERHKESTKSKNTWPRDSNKRTNHFAFKSSTMKAFMSPKMLTMVSYDNFLGEKAYINHYCILNRCSWGKKSKRCIIISSRKNSIQRWHCHCGRIKLHQRVSISAILYRKSNRYTSLRSSNRRSCWYCKKMESK